MLFFAYTYTHTHTHTYLVFPLECLKVFHCLPEAIHKYTWVSIFASGGNVDFGTSVSRQWEKMLDTHRLEGCFTFILKEVNLLHKMAWLLWFRKSPAAAAAKSLQSCLTLCDPIDGSPPGSPVPGILQARTLEWVAISFSNAWQWKLEVILLSHVWFFATLWAAAYQAPPSVGFSRQEYWSGVPLPSPRKSPSVLIF